MESQCIELGVQHQKLLDAPKAGAIPLDLLKAEQDRIAGQPTRIEDQLASPDVNFEQARAVLVHTLDLTRDCHSAYLQANDHTRCLFNQAFFAKIYFDEDDETREQTVRVNYNEPFDSLLSRLIPASVHRSLGMKKTALRENPMGGFEADVRRTDKVQDSHTDTLVVLARLFSNSAPSPLSRAISAYRRSHLTESITERAPRPLRRRTIRLNGLQVSRLVNTYQSGASVSGLAAEYGVNRSTVSLRLKEEGVIMRLRTPDYNSIEDMVRLYISGLSLARVGTLLGVSARTVQRHLETQGVRTRDTQGRLK